MKKIISLVILVSLFLINLEANESPLQHTNKLVANGKNVMLLFETATCPYCKIFKKDIVEDELLNKLLRENFNVYSIPLDKEMDYEMGDKNPPKKTNTISLKMGFAVKATPQIIIFDENWNKIIQLPGYADPEMMKIFINYVLKDIYKTKDLETYLKDTGLMK